MGSVVELLPRFLVLVKVVIRRLRLVRARDLYGSLKVLAKRKTNARVDGAPRVQHEVSNEWNHGSKCT